MDTEIGFIGLGNMGSGLALNLLNNGVNIFGFDADQTKANALVPNGLIVTSSTKELSEKCQVVILCLPHPDITEQVIFQELLAGNTKVKTIIETSTLSPEYVVDVSKRLKEKKIDFLSSPMIGGASAALNGNITFLVEGYETSFEKWKDIFLKMGNAAQYAGLIPAASITKLIFNMCRYANIAVAIEGYRLLKVYGTDPNQVYDFLAEQSLDNFGQVWKEDMQATYVKGEMFKPSAVPKKDLNLLCTMAINHNLDPALLKAIRNVYTSLE